MPPGPPPSAVHLLIEVVTPYLGRHMASAAVLAHVERMGIGHRAPTASELEDLLERLCSGLSVFVGRTKADAILTEARAAVSNSRGAP